MVGGRIGGGDFLVRGSKGFIEFRGIPVSFDIDGLMRGNSFRPGSSVRGGRYILPPR